MAEKEFDRLLQKRAVPQASDGLAERIVAAAGMRPSSRGAFAFGPWLGAFAESFALPRPALALGVCLALGFFAGMGIDGPAEDVPEPESLVAYLDMDEEDWS